MLKLVDACSPKKLQHEEIAKGKKPDIQRQKKANAIAVDIKSGVFIRRVQAESVMADIPNMNGQYVRFERGRQFQIHEWFGDVARSRCRLLAQSLIRICI